MVYIVLFIAVFNLGLGYAVAARLGRRYRALLAEELGLGGPLPPRSDSDAETAPGAEEPAGSERENAEPKEESRCKVIDGLLDDSTQYRALLDETSKIVEQAPRPNDASEHGDWLDRLSEGTEAYLDQRQSREAELRCVVESEELDAQREAICSVWEQQDAQLHQLSNATDQLMADPETEEYWEAFGQQVNELLASTNSMDALLGEAKNTLDAGQSSPDKPAESAAHSGRVRSVPDKLCATVPESEGCPCMAMMDVDHVEQLNQRYGRTAVDRMLNVLYELVQTEGRNGATVEQVDSQRFVLTFSNPDARRAANIVERLRQTIGKTRFVYDNREIQATVSCAVGEPDAGADVAALLERTTAALGEAKHYGRDRTFLHRGDFPAPVVPPTLSVAETRTLLDAAPPVDEPPASEEHGD